MNSFLDLVKLRASIRAYESRTVEEEKLRYIMECVRLAPSAVNRQPWKFFAITSTAEKEKLYRCYNRDWFRQAPMVFLACANHLESWKRGCDGKDHADVDVSIAVEHLCLAAADCGLGSCWVCNFDAPLCVELFGLPSTMEPVAFIPIGYPAMEGKMKERKPVEEVFMTL